MNIVESANAAEQKLDEKYSANNSYFLRYMQGNDGDTTDPYQAWWEICEWLEDNDYLDDISELISQKNPDQPVAIQDADELREYDADIFYLLPQDVQRQAYEHAVEQMMQHNAAEAPTTAHMDLQNNKLLDRETWLVHFSDDAGSIAHNGFKYGMDRMDNLGLTTYYTDNAKAHGGYNFAFLADSRYAKWAAQQGKYGKNAVIFQNSGVHCYHHGDEEDQIVFWGADVEPNGIVLLVKDYEEWQVVPTGSHQSREYFFKGEFEECVNWVEKNFRQYRNVLTAGRK